MEILGGDLIVEKFRGAENSAEEILDHGLLLLFLGSQIAASDVRVVDAGVNARKFSHEVAFLVEFAFQDFCGHVVLDGLLGHGHKRFAFRPADEVAGVRFVGRNQVLLGLGRRVHYYVFALLVHDGVDGVVEPGVGRILVFLGTDQDKDGISFQPGHAVQGAKQGGLVAADAVAVLKSYLDVVRLVARGDGLGREAAVADLLGDPAVQRFGFLANRLLAFRQLFGERFHFRSGDGHSRFAKIDVPLGDDFPARDGAEIVALAGDVEGCHGGFGEDLGNVAYFPAVVDQISHFLFLLNDSAGYFEALGDVSQRFRFRSVNFDGLFLKRRHEFADEAAGPGVFHPGFVDDVDRL